MTTHEGATLVMAVLAAHAGFAAGWLHFASLERVAAMIVQGRLSAIGLQLARIALLGCLLWLFAKGGGLILVAGAAGIVAGRSLVLRRAR
jgi:hypothetical protein